MQAKVVSGPYKGRVLDHNDLNLYCTFFLVGAMQFFRTCHPSRVGTM